MKKLILSVIMSVVFTASFSLAAQDTAKKEQPSNKEKTECTKTCTKDKKEKCNKEKDNKACCSKAKDSKCTKEAGADKKTCCSKTDKK